MCSDDRFLSMCQTKMLERMEECIQMADSQKEEHAGKVLGTGSCNHFGAVCMEREKGLVCAKRKEYNEKCKLRLLAVALYLGIWHGLGSAFHAVICHSSMYNPLTVFIFVYYSPTVSDDATYTLNDQWV